MPPSLPKAPVEPDWDLLKQKKPTLSLEHIESIAELSELYLKTGAEATEFTEDDLLSNLRTLYELSLQKSAKMKRSHAKKIEKIAMAAISAFGSNRLLPPTADTAGTGKGTPRQIDHPGHRKHVNEPEPIIKEQKSDKHKKEKTKKAVKPIVLRRNIWTSQPDETRKKIVEFLHELRTNQRKDGFKGFPNIHCWLEIEIEDELRARAPKGPVAFLDLGAGLGGAISIAEALHKNITAYGLSIARPPAISPEKWVIGMYEDIVIPDFFDVIQSRHGIEWARNHAVAIENAVNSLKEGGAFFLSHTDIFGKKNQFDPVKLEANRAAIISALEAQDCKVTLTKSMIRIEKGKKKADLSSLYSSDDMNEVPLVMAGRI